MRDYGGRPLSRSRDVPTHSKAHTNHILTETTGEIVLDMHTYMYVHMTD